MKRSSTIRSLSHILAVIAITGCGPAREAPPAVSDSSATISPTPPPVGSHEETLPECPHCALTPHPESRDSEAYRRSPWLGPGMRRNAGVLNLPVTDQDGQRHNLADLCDRPTALSFLYTRCTNPNKCPRVAREMAKLQAMLKAEQLDTQVRLLIMTYDPAYDTPSHLHQFGEKHGFHITPHMMMLRPDSQAKDRFFENLEVAVNYDASGVNLHGVQLFLFDRQGRVVRQYKSVFWTNSEVLGDLKQLAQESESTGNR